MSQRRGVKLQISPNGRHFATSDGNPFFWLGDTQWNLWRCHTLPEARTILENRKHKGFTVIQVMLMGWGWGMESDPVFRVPAPTVHGEAYPERELSRPNPRFFDHVDHVVEEALRLGLVLVVGLDHPRLMLASKPTARAWGRWVGERYRAFPNIVWVPSYTIPDQAHLDVTREIAAGLSEGDGGTHLLTSHPDPADPYCTSGIAHGEEWLAFNCIQTWARFDCIHEAVSGDYRRASAKPVVMAEGAYEGGAEYGFAVTPLVVRRQAYWTYLSGGHHSYGHNDNWQVPPSWRESLDAPGAVEMGICRDLLERVAWWELVPDQSLIRGEAGSGASLRVAARAASSAWIMAYLPQAGSVSLRTRGILASGRPAVSWADPRTGEIVRREEGAAGEYLEAQAPEGLVDALLLLQAV